MAIYAVVQRARCTSHMSLISLCTIQRAYATHPRDAKHDEDVRQAKAFLQDLPPDGKIFPRDACQISFNRASGPGGQNVNKVNTKARVEIAQSVWGPAIPNLLHPSIIASRHCTKRSHELMFESDETRSQATNIDRCFAKLRDCIVSAGRESIPGETSPEQAARVKKLDRKNNESRLRMKKMQSQKKGARKQGGSD